MRLFFHATGADRNFLRKLASITFILTLAAPLVAQATATPERAKATCVAANISTCPPPAALAETIGRLEICDQQIKSVTNKSAHEYFAAEDARQTNVDKLHGCLVSEKDTIIKESGEYQYDAYVKVVNDFVVTQDELVKEARKACTIADQNLSDRTTILDVGIHNLQVCSAAINVIKDDKAKALFDFLIAQAAQQERWSRLHSFLLRAKSSFISDDREYAYNAYSLALDQLNPGAKKAAATHEKTTRKKTVTRLDKDETIIGSETTETTTEKIPASAAPSPSCDQNKRYFGFIQACSIEILPVGLTLVNGVGRRSYVSSANVDASGFVRVTAREEKIFRYFLTSSAAYVVDKDSLYARWFVAANIGVGVQDSKTLLNMPMAGVSLGLLAGDNTFMYLTYAGFYNYDAKKITYPFIEGHPNPVTGLQFPVTASSIAANNAIVVPLEKTRGWYRGWGFGFTYKFWTD